MKHLLLLILTTIILQVTWLNAHANISPANRSLWQGVLEKGNRLVPAREYPFQEIFQRASIKYNIPVAVLLAVARGESFFNPRAENSVPCIGIMQIRWPITANHLGIHRKEDLYDPEINIMAGARYLREMLDFHNNDLHLALAAYHHGPGNIYREIAWNRIPPKADWYTGYIHHHFSKLQLMDGDGEILTAGTSPARIINPDRDGHVTLIEFNMKFRVDPYIKTIENRIGDIRLEYFKQYRRGSWRYDIVIIYDSLQELKDVVERYIHAYHSTPIEPVKLLLSQGCRAEDIKGLNPKTAREIERGYF